MEPWQSATNRTWIDFHSREEAVMEVELANIRLRTTYFKIANCESSQSNLFTNSEAALQYQLCEIRCDVLRVSPTRRRQRGIDLPIGESS